MSTPGVPEPSSTLTQQLLRLLDQQKKSLGLPLQSTDFFLYELRAEKIGVILAQVDDDPSSADNSLLGEEYAHVSRRPKPVCPQFFLVLVGHTEKLTAFVTSSVSALVERLRRKQRLPELYKQRNSL